MRIITVNLNGIRSATKKGFLDWIQSQEADVICMQECRIQHEQLTSMMQAPGPFGSHFYTAEKKGYSGVGFYFKKSPDQITEGIGWPEFDREARFLQADYGNLSIISIYLPSGSSGEERQAFKFQVLDHFVPWFKERMKDGREYILCGDWNIAHHEIDLKNWKGNKKNSGFLPEERAWLTQLYDEIGFVDVFRQLNPNEHQYTWWSNRGRAWDNNVGWRLDYQVATPGIAKTATAESIFKEVRYSDHAPLTIDYDYAL